METAALLAPVTALEFLHNKFLLSGEGPVLTVYSLHPHPKASASLSVLQHNRIHGIRPRCPTAVSSKVFTSETCEVEKNERNSSTEPDSYDLAVFGGKAVRLVRLHVDLQHRKHLHLEILSPLLELRDWALDVRWLLGDQHSLLCVAVAHNSALLLDAVTGNVLVQRSCQEGCLLYSALLVVHESWADTVLVGGTVFNQLVVWKPGGGDQQIDSSVKAPVERRLVGHSGVIFSITYLQQKGLLASASDDRSVRLWDAGSLGGAGGQCGHVNPACLRVLYGHQARVFSVCLSPGRVFSAGEDGACLVWDGSAEGKVVRTLKGHRAGGVRALAVSEGTEDEGRWVATGGADGGVRLWRVEGGEKREDRMEEPSTEKLVDLKFPCQGMPKVVCSIAGESDNESWSQSKFVVCTELGEVFQFSSGQWEMIWQCSLEIQSYCMMETTAVRVQDSTQKVNLCALGNVGGFVHVFSISQPQCGVLLTTGSGKIHSLIWQDVEGDVYLLASGAEGLVFRWCVKVRLDENSSLALSVDPWPPFLLPPCAKRWLTAAVPILTASGGLLWVCGDRRGSLLLFQEGEKRGQEVQGGKKLAEDLSLHPLSRLFGVHGKQGVTSVRKHKGLLYSTGRDGCVRVFRVCQTQEKLGEKGEEDRGGLHLEVLRVQRACKGMEWLEGVLFLEPDIPVEEEEEEEVGNVFEIHHKAKKQILGEEQEAKEEESSDEEEEEKAVREAKFVIVGFQGVHLVVWDPLRQERLLTVPCGGGHRSWSLWPSHKGVWRGYGAVVFIKQRALLASQPTGESLSSAGKAGSSRGWSLREGVHGRGIGCACRLGRVSGVGKEVQQTAGNPGEADRLKGGHWEVVVTGGDDTSLTVLAVHPGSGAVKVLSVITDHISSVRTLLAVARPEAEGKHRTLSALLVSAGGRAQMQCYRLLVDWDRQRRAPSCQVIQVAGHRLDEQWERKRNRHKTVKMDPETRYMSVAVLDENPDRVLLAFACSDGALRLFAVSEVKRRIDLLWETFYHQRCVLSVASGSLEDRTGNRYKLLFSAATDGKIAAWDLTEACTASADGSSGAPVPPIPCLDIPAHQSGVNSLAVWMENLEQQEGGCLVTVASGGDDGQLTASTIRVQYPQGAGSGGSRGVCHMPEPPVPQQSQFQRPTRISLQVHNQVHVPLAHAAPLTALKLLRSGLLVSTSADQRVCLWRAGTSAVSHIGALCSHIADAAGLAVWEGQMSEEEEEEEEEEEAKRKTRFGAEHSGKTGLKRMFKTDKTATAVSHSHSEANCTERVETASETGEPVCTSGETGSETAAGSRSQTISVEERGGTGWVLVCGQGFQLLRVRNTDG